MVSASMRTPLQRIDSTASCEHCGVSENGSGVGVFAVRHGSTDTLQFECDSCGWSSKTYRYTGDETTSLTLLYDGEVRFNGGEVYLDRKPLHTHPGYVATF